MLNLATVTVTVTVVFLFALAIQVKAQDKDCSATKETHVSSVLGVTNTLTGHPNFEGSLDGSFVEYREVCSKAFGEPTRWMKLAERTVFGRTHCKQHCVAIFVATKKYGYSNWPKCGPRRNALKWSKSHINEKDLVKKIGCSTLNFLNYTDGRSYHDIPYRHLRLEYKDPQDTYQDDGYLYIDLLKNLKPTSLFLYYVENSKGLEKFGPGGTAKNKPYLNYIADSFKDSLEEFAVLGGLSMFQGPKYEYSNLTAAVMSLSKLKVLSIDNIFVEHIDMIPYPEQLEFFKIELPADLLESGYELDLNPQWLTRARKLLVLMFFVVPLKSLKNMDQLESLEIFKAEQTYLSEIPATGFLTKSTKLKSLDLSCNLITNIAPGAFDHFRELEILRLAGNAIQFVEPAVISSLSNLQMLDIRRDRNKRGGSSSATQFWDVTSRSTEFWCRRTSYDRTPYPTVPMFDQHTVEHYQGLNNLQALMLGPHPSMELDPKIFSNLKHLKDLRADSINLKSLDPLKEAMKNCMLRVMSLWDNDFHDPNWLTYEWVSNMKPNIQTFFFGGSNLTKITGPVYFLTKMTDTMKWQVDWSLQKSEISNNPCQKEIWGALMRNRKVLPADVDDECRVQFNSLQAEIDEWKGKIFSPEQVKYCRAFLNGAGSVGVGVGFIGTTILILLNTFL